MKRLALPILMSVLFTNLTLASAAFANTIQTHLPNIQDRVRQCSILPYTYRREIKVYHSLMSHCPEVKVTEKGKAKIKVAGHTFFVSIEETRDSDGDYYNVHIQEPISNDRYDMTYVRAYNDVLLGILQGNPRGVTESYVPPRYEQILQD